MQTYSTPTTAFETTVKVITSTKTSRDATSSISDTNQLSYYNTFTTSVPLTIYPSSVLTSIEEDSINVYTSMLGTVATNVQSSLLGTMAAVTTVKPTNTISMRQMSSDLDTDQLTYYSTSDTSTFKTVNQSNAFTSIEDATATFFTSFIDKHSMTTLRNVESINTRSISQHSFQVTESMDVLLPTSQTIEPSRDPSVYKSTSFENVETTHNTIITGDATTEISIPQSTIQLFPLHSITVQPSSSISTTQLYSKSASYSELLNSESSVYTQNSNSNSITPETVSSDSISTKIATGSSAITSGAYAETNGTEILRSTMTAKPDSSRTLTSMDSSNNITNKTVSTDMIFPTYLQNSTAASNVASFSNTSSITYTILQTITPSFTSEYTMEMSSTHTILDTSSSNLTSAMPSQTTLGPSTNLQVTSTSLRSNTINVTTIVPSYISELSTNLQSTYTLLVSSTVKNSTSTMSSHSTPINPSINLKTTPASLNSQFTTGIYHQSTRIKSGSISTKLTGIVFATSAAAPSKSSSTYLNPTSITSSSIVTIPVDTKKFLVSGKLNETFTPELENEESEQYKNLSNRLDKKVSNSNPSLVW